MDSEFVGKIAEAGEVVGDKFHDLEEGLANNNKLLVMVNDKIDHLISLLERNVEPQTS